MKKLTRPSAIIVFAIMIFINVNCSKKEEAAAACKTCKAFGSGVDQGNITRQVCTDEEEVAFRSEFAGREISCQ